MLSLQRLYKLAVRAYMASCYLSLYSWFKNTALTDSQRVVLISMKFRLMATLRVAKKRKGRKAVFANTNTMTPVYFLGFWQKDRISLIETTLSAINNALSGIRPDERDGFRKAIQYLEELSLYVWKNETIRIANETDPKNLLPMLDLALK